jgi:hypothetical protein
MYPEAIFQLVRSQQQRAGLLSTIRNGKSSSHRPTSELPFIPIRSDQFVLFFGCRQSSEMTSPSPT